MPLRGEDQRVLLDAARRAIRSELTGSPCDPTPLPENDGLLCRPAGCFVTLHEVVTRRLRGCVGRIDSPDPLLTTLHHAALSVLKDPRFTDDPVVLDELRDLELEITVLSPLQLATCCTDFEPLVHGIYLTAGGRAGCFLPQVARETGWTREQLLSRLCTEKLCYPADAWQHPSAQLFTFTAEIVGPEAFAPSPSGRGLG